MGDMKLNDQSKTFHACILPLFSCIVIVFSHRLSYTCNTYSFGLAWYVNKEHKAATVCSSLLHCFARSGKSELVICIAPPSVDTNCPSHAIDFWSFTALVVPLKMLPQSPWRPRKAFIEAMAHNNDRQAD